MFTRKTLQSLFICIVFCFAGCTATMVSPPGTPSASPYAPLNEQSRGGIIKYLNQGAASVLRSRRENAYKQMHQACNGFYTIDAEGPKVEGGVVTSMPTGMVYSQTEYWYIQFSCVPRSQ